MKIYPFIMCGGAGTRLWPMSTQARPKQFHHIVSDFTMLQDTAKRGQDAGEIEIAAPSFVCSSRHRDLVMDQCRAIGVDPECVILEPSARNTAAVAATIAEVMSKKDKDGLILLLPADHHIERVEAFWEYIQKGCESAVSGHIVTFGIHPTHAETGYGYIQAGEKNRDQSRKILEFVEKPDAATARKYLKDGRYFWNAGIFLFTAEAMKGAFEAHATDILQSVQKAVKGSTLDSSIIALDANAFAECRSDSVDYAIMEKAENVSLVGPLNIGWNDIGSWRAVWEQENAKFGKKAETYIDMEKNACAINSRDVLIRSSGPFVAAVGIKNIAIIATPESVLVIDLNASQDVKKVVEKLKTEGGHSLV